MQTLFHALFLLFCLGPALAARVPNTTLRMPAQFPVVGYGMMNAFGNLTFDQPIAIASPPGETNRIFIAEKSGRIFVVTNLVQPTKTEFLDATADLIANGEAGLLGLAFHPGYATNGCFYIYRTINVRFDAVHFGIHDEVARYSVDPQDPNRALPGSKLPLFAQYDSSDQHNGGDLQFGPDGYLYVTVGDTGPFPGEGSTEPQPIDQYFFGSILRLDVDKQPGNLQPNSFPGGTTNYAVPRDNPFIGATKHNGRTIDPTRVRTELYAIGFRNPWRITFDGNRLYCADVGSAGWEEIDLIAAGGNYGWPFFEAHRLNEQAPPGFTYIKPLYSYTRGNRLQEGSCVIGGRVYRGEKLPGLYGAYLFADFVAERIWALKHTGNTVTEVENVAGVPSPTAFGVDPANGDILVASMDGHIRRLIYVTPETVAQPITLADTGAFADLRTLSVNPGIVPYEVAVPFWSDNAIKTRWFSLPDPEQAIGFSGGGNWTLPEGMVWIKHFELEMTKGVPASRKRIETRFLVKNATGVYGVTYRWGNSLTNATLVGDAGLEETFVVRDGGAVRMQTWIYPGRNDCLKCHNPSAGYALGFNTPQMNCNVLTSQAPKNQIQFLSEAGYFDNPTASPSLWPVLAHPTNDAVAIEHRARSYLHANCAQCHHPAGPTGIFWNARIDVAMSAANILNGRLASGADPYRVIKPGDVDASVLMHRISSHYGRMPPVSSSVLDVKAIDLLADYIRGLPMEPWSCQDIGVTLWEGSSSILDGVYSIAGSGTNIGGKADAFHFLFQSLRGNGRIVARVVSQGTLIGQAGIMMRASIASNASFGMLSAAAENRLQFRCRHAVNEETTLVTDATASATWFRLVREGNLLRAYSSATGDDWTLLGEQTANLGETALVGLAATSSNNWKAVSGVFDQVSILAVKLSVPESASNSLVTEPIELRAEASASGISIRKVEFYDGPVKIDESRQFPYGTTWDDATAGEHAIRARVIAVSGEAVWSEPALVHRQLPATRLGRKTTDLTRQGNWKGKYGAEGVFLAANFTNLPPQFTCTISGHLSELWARAPLQRRALQNYRNARRRAAAFTSPTNFSVNLTFADGGLHKVSLYFVDWERPFARVQLVEIFDASTGALLSSDRVSDFRRGVYLSYSVRGTIQIRLTRINGVNAVLSGIFIDPASSSPPTIAITAPQSSQAINAPGETTVEASASDPDGIQSVEVFVDDNTIGAATTAPFRVPWQVPPGVYTIRALATDGLGERQFSPSITVTATLPSAVAQLIRIDKITQGNWRGAYGLEGFAIPGHATNYPAYATVGVGSPIEYVYFPEYGPRELQKVDGSGQILSTWLINSPTHLQFHDGSHHVLAIYFLDPERTRHQRLTIRDGATDGILFTDELPSFGDGQYFVFNVRGHLKIDLATVLGPNTCISGFFFDPLPSASPDNECLLHLPRVIDGRLAFTVVKNRGAPEMPFTIETSDDLTNWRTVPEDEMSVIDTDYIGASEQVTIQLAAPTSTKQRVFLRLRLNLTEP